MPERINAITTDVIQKMKNIAENAQPGDMIEVYICGHVLIDPPWIHLCKADKIATEQNLCRINEIPFKESALSDLLAPITTALDRMQRQSAYRLELLLFADNLSDPLFKTVFEGRIALLQKRQKIRFKLFVPSGNLSYTSKPSCSSRISRTDSLHDKNNNNNHDSVLHQKTLLYDRNHSIKQCENLRTSYASDVYVGINPVQVNTNVRVEETTSLTTKAKRLICRMTNKISLLYQNTNRTSSKIINSTSSPPSLELDWYLSMRKTTV